MSSGAYWWHKSLQIAFYEIMWKNILEPDRPQMTTQRLRIACWIPKDTIHYNNGYANAPHCYFIRTLPVLCILYPVFLLLRCFGEEMINTHLITTLNMICIGHTG